MHCRVDLSAKKITKDRIGIHQNIPFKHISLGLGTTTCGRYLISFRLQHPLYKIIMKSKLMERHAEALDIPSDILRSMVDWKVMAKARKEDPLYLNIFITKWVSGETATGLVMIKMKQIINPTYSMCQACEEDATHILKCPNQSITSLRQELLNDMDEWLISTHTHQAINTFLYSGLASWFTSNPFVIDPSLDPNLQIVF